MTKPNRVPQVLLSHTEGADELSPPGMWALGSTGQQLCFILCLFPTLSTFSRRFHIH